jgi:glucose repression regulatory protein TUP1
MAQPQQHQHRTLQPAGGPPPTAVVLNRQRLDDSLDVIKQEFEYMSQELSAMRNQRDEYEAKSELVLLRLFVSLLS